MHRSSSTFWQLASSSFSGSLSNALTALWLGLWAASTVGNALGQDQPGEGAGEAVERLGFVVQVDLPLVGDRDEQVRQQIVRIADSNAEAEQRPIVVLRFQAAPLAELGFEPDNGGMGTRGSQFERCLALARFLTSAESARVRMVAYLPESVEGHAVLPVLACEEIVASNDAELGRASIDEPLDATIEGAYRDVVRRRAILPEAVALSMLDRNAEVYALELTDGGSMIAGRDEAKQLRDEAKVLQEETIWRGGSLASYSGKMMRGRRWISSTVNDESQLAASLGLTGSLRTAKQLPREWKPVSLTLSGSLTASRLNQIIRALEEQIRDDEINLLVVRLEQTSCDFDQATRLASYIADLDSDKVYSISLVSESLTGAVGLIATACREVVLVQDATLGPLPDQMTSVLERDSAQLVLGDLATRTGRPLPLLSVLADSSVSVQEFIHQQTGKRAIFANWQVKAQADVNQWLAKRKIAGGEAISQEAALRYHLVDSVGESATTALGRLGVREIPPELSTPWLDASIQMVLAQGWLPRLLLMIGFFALMAELGNPGLGVGGFLSAMCFLGFFWIEGLNGNVEALEVILFVAGLVALALEIFVVPGFGVFGISGMLMVLVSVVLASQTFIWPTTSAQLSEVSVNLFWVACLALGGMIGLLFMHKQLERMPLFRWVSLEPDEDVDERAYREAMAHRDHFLHQEGLTTTRLNPSGKAQFGRDIVPVVGTGKMIDEGVPVRVVEVRGNLILVEEI